MWERVVSAYTNRRALVRHVVYVCLFCVQRLLFVRCIHTWKRENGDGETDWQVFTTPLVSNIFMHLGSKTTEAGQKKKKRRKKRITNIERLCTRCSVAAGSISHWDFAIHLTVTDILIYNNDVFRRWLVIGVLTEGRRCPSDLVQGKRRGEEVAGCFTCAYAC